MDIYIYVCTYVCVHIHIHVYTYSAGMMLGTEAVACWRAESRELRAMQGTRPLGSHSCLTPPVISGGDWPTFGKKWAGPNTPNVIIKILTRQIRQMFP